MTDIGTLSRDKPAGLGGRSPVADPPVAAPPGAAVSGPDVLLATKLHVPGPPPGFVPRPRLVQALGEGLARGRMLVCAPAGFGKTALLAGWARGDGRPVAWLGLDGGDSDPARFWRHAVAALDRARPGLAGRVGPPPPGSLAGLVTALINELAADPGPDEVLLVLDDYHLAGSGPVHKSVAFLLENLPPGLRVVVSSRSATVSFLQLFGIGAGFAVIIDATLVRAVLVPACQRILGRAAWYAPAPLRRLQTRIRLAEARG